VKEYTLPKEFAEKWIAALRSGQYKQTTDRLKAKDECAYCCIGVACVIQGYNDSQVMEDNGELNEIKINLDDYGDEVEYPLHEQYGIPMAMINGNLPNELINLNDSEKLSFTEIADWIEDNVDFD
jgi:hypothetical protein